MLRLSSNLNLCPSFLAAQALQPQAQQQLPIEITEHPRSITVQDGSSCSLYCRANGNPTPHIQWFKNNKILDEEAVAGSMIMDGAGTIDFLSVSRGGTRNNNDDSGNYWCRASNQFGSVDSRNATLTVAWLGPRFQKSPEKTYYVEAGERALLDCAPPRGTPDPVVHWNFNGNPVENSNTQKINIDATGNLIIYQSNVNNRGEYQCVASQKQVPESPGRYSQMAKLEVLGKYFGL